MAAAAEAGMAAAAAAGMAGTPGLAADPTVTAPGPLPAHARCGKLASIDARTRGSTSCRTSRKARAAQQSGRMAWRAVPRCCVGLLRMRVSATITKLVRAYSQGSSSRERRTGDREQIAIRFVATKSSAATNPASTGEMTQEATMPPRPLMSQLRQSIPGVPTRVMPTTPPTTA